MFGMRACMCVFSMLKSCWSSMHLLFLHDSGKFRHSHGTESSSTRFHLALPIHTCIKWINCRISIQFFFPFQSNWSIVYLILFQTKQNKTEKLFANSFFSNAHTNIHIRRFENVRNNDRLTQHRCSYGEECMCVCVCGLCLCCASDFYLCLCVHVLEVIGMGVQYTEIASECILNIMIPWNCVKPGIYRPNGACLFIFTYAQFDLKPKTFQSYWKNVKISNFLSLLKSFL